MRFAVATTSIVYLVLLVAIGAVLARRQARFADYVTGGGRIPAWMLAISFFANFVSSNSFVGHASKSYEVGLSWLGVAAVMVVCCAISWGWFAPRFARFAAETGALTLPDFFEKKWSRTAGVVVAVIVVVATLFYVLAVMRGTALAVQSGLEIGYVEALVVIWIVTVVYCLFGGLWADVSTDVVQALLLVVGAGMLFVGVLAADGTPATTPIRPAPFGLVFAVGLGGGLKLLSDPKQVMVFYAFKDETSARRFRIAGPLLLFAVYACLFPLGYLARRVVPHVADLETLVPSLATGGEILPSWFAPIFIVALLAASMSSLDSALLVMASVAEKHLLAPLLGRTKPSLTRTRLLLASSSLFALLLSLRPIAGIIRLTTFAGALLGAGLLPTIVAGLAGWKVSPRTALASVVGGALGAVVGAAGAGRVATPWFQDVLVGLVFAIVPLAIGARSARDARPQ